MRFVNSTVRFHMRNGAAQTLWTGRTRLEQILMVLVTCLILLASILLIVIGKEQEATGIVTTKPETDEFGNQKNVCLKPECVKVAAAIISDLDTDTHPCDDFYKVSVLLNYRYVHEKKIQKKM